MSSTSWSESYNQLPPGEQALFAETIKRLLAEGLVWREEEDDRRVFSFLLRRRDLVEDYLQIAGWTLQHDERLGIFQVLHREGAHRRRLMRDTTIWLLLLRLIYAEQQEHNAVRLTRYPVVSVGEIRQRYAEFFPGQAVRKKTSLDEALRTLAGLKLIRAAGGGLLRTGSSEQQVELLPTLEVVVPANEIQRVADQLREYKRDPKAEAEADTADGDPS